MKNHHRLLLLALALPLASKGAIFVETYDFTTSPVPFAVPDNMGTPVSDTRNIVSSVIQKITDVEVTVRLENSVQAGAYNGDYYLSLQHGSGFAVLLNRVGRRAGSSTGETLGYSDNGFNVTFKDSASLGDIHNYRVTLNGNDNTPIDATFTQSLTGVWAPDGRNVSPLTVLSSDSRTQLLSALKDQPANGGWTLQAVDFNGGGEANVLSWSIKVTGYDTVVPEPISTTVFAGLGLGAWAFIRKRHQRAKG